MAHFSPMIDMAKAPAEPMKIPEIKADKPSAPIYPYGLTLRFDKETLEKIGCSTTDLPSPGEMIHLCALAVVTHVSKPPNNPDLVSVELQISHLACESEDEENDEMRRERFYGDDEEVRKEAVSY
jgi:hypothetical protein